MKNIFLIMMAFTPFLLGSCQDVIDVPLDTETPRLVINASINWEKGTKGDKQSIILTTTSDFYSRTSPSASGAKVSIANSKGVVFNFVEKTNTGNYSCTTFVPELDETYRLTILYKGETYEAEEKLMSVAKIENQKEPVYGNGGALLSTTNGIAQEVLKGFGSESIKISAFFKDPENQKNYYLFRYKYSTEAGANFALDDDENDNGKIKKSIDFKDKLKPGDTVDITHYGVSLTYYNYARILFEISGNSGGRPFQTPPATVRGNIENKTNFKNYALGYFRLSECSKVVYTIK